MTQPAPQPVVVQRPHPEGMEGVRLSAQEVAARIGRDMRDPEVLKWSRRTIAEANLPGVAGTRFPEPTAVVQALFAALKKIVAAVKDPLGTELMFATRHLLCLDSFCVRAGDCDDLLIALGSCTMSLGIPVRLRVRRYAKQAQAHITMLYDSNRKIGGPWLCMDPTMESGKCSDAPYAEEFTIDVNPGNGELMFIGIGDPPDDVGGDLGDAPAELPADQAAAWVAQVQIGRDALDRSRTNLRTLAAAYAQVRTDLGVPQFDATYNEATAGASALSAYAQTSQWTAQAASDEGKLLQAADFLSSCLSDALAGRRPLSFDPDARDVLVGTLPGDPYRVLLQTPPGAAGPVPTVLDAQGQVEGTLGILQFLVGAGIVAVVTLAAAYAVGKICDYLAQKHHDDAIAKVSDNQTNLIAEGKMTPEQAKAQTDAMSTLATASKIDEPGFLSGWTGLAAAAAAGLALGFGGEWLLAHLRRAA